MTPNSLQTAESIRVLFVCERVEEKISIIDTELQENWHTLDLLLAAPATLLVNRQLNFCFCLFFSSFYLGRDSYFMLSLNTVKDHYQQALKETPNPVVEDNTSIRCCVILEAEIKRVVYTLFALWTSVWPLPRKTRSPICNRCLQCNVGKWHWSSL